MSRTIVLLSSTLLLASCSVREANLDIFERQRPITPTEKAAIIDHIRNTFFDPYSVRDAEISNSAPSGSMDLASATYMICLKANGKNRMGAYAGRQATLFYFEASGQLLRATDDDFGFCDNQQLHYSIFPEAESIGAK